MDNGYALTTSTANSTALTLAPCFQTGQLSVPTVPLVGGTAQSPTDFCGTSLDSADSPDEHAVTSGTAVTWSSIDNRAVPAGRHSVPEPIRALSSPSPSRPESPVR